MAERSFCLRLSENRAVSGLLVAAAAALLAAFLAPTGADASVAAALAAAAPLAMPRIEPFVERREMALIVEAATAGAKFVIVDGGNAVGKSVAVEAAAAILSRNGRVVLPAICEAGDSAAGVLQRIFGLERPASLIAHMLGAVAKTSPSRAPPPVAEIRRALIARAPGAEPVFVVEMAERLAVAEIKALLDLAKEVVDKRSGRFVFVFSPNAGAFDAIRSFGSLSRAKVVHVGSLDAAEAAKLLTGLGCNEDRAASFAALVGGHLPHLICDSALHYCGGAQLSLRDAEAELLAGVAAQVKVLDRVHGPGAACAGLCGVASEKWPPPSLLDALLRAHLVIASLQLDVIIESRLVQSFMTLRCNCELSAAQLPAPAERLAR
jgi:hypothetical protein